MQRRRFIKNTIATGLLTAITPRLISCSNIPKEFEIGIMLNTVASQMRANYRETLQLLRDIGYRYVEGDAYGDSLVSYAETLREIGLASIGHGGALGELLEGYDQYLKKAELLNQQYIICYYPWMVANQDINAERSYEAAKLLNTLGKRVRKSGFRFCWHPHNFELKDVGNDQTPLAIIMENTDPEYVSIQLDTYWMVRGGQDPVRLLEKYPGRTKMFHLKDISPTGQNACLGSGSIDFSKIMEVAKSQDIQFLTVEREQKNTTLHCAKTAMDQLASGF